MGGTGVSFPSRPYPRGIDGFPLFLKALRLREPTSLQFVRQEHGGTAPTYIREPIEWVIRTLHEERQRNQPCVFRTVDFGGVGVIMVGGGDLARVAKGAAKVARALLDNEGPAAGRQVLRLKEHSVGLASSLTNVGPSLDCGCAAMVLDSEVSCRCMYCTNCCANVLTFYTYS